MRVNLLSAAGTLALIAGAAPGAEPDRKPGPDARALTASIDRRIEAVWKANSITPAPPASDAEFIRRVYLDLAGRIPRVQEVRAFLDDPNPAKRAVLIDRLLEGAGYVQHFSTIYRREWLPQTVSNPQLQFLGVQFEQWLRKQLRDNRTYGQIVQDLVTVSPSGGVPGGPAEAAAPAPVSFLLVNEFKPENMAATTSRLFLGVKIECAQCHDHPFDTYKREQFWEFASFFAGLMPTDPRARRGPTEAIEIRSLSIPGTDKKVEARFINGGKPEFKEKVSSRVTLAQWMTSRDNPYFARNAVNRMWAHLFGVGIIDPIDESTDKNPPSHPELLNDLARGFADSGYDLKFLIRVIVNSRAYQLSSSAPGASTTEERLFARMRVRGLTPEQLFDSLALASGYRENRPATDFIAPNSPRGEFLSRFATTERLSEVQTSILQALTLMNGKFIGDMTSIDAGRSETLSAVLDAPFFDTPQKIEALYLAALSRKPRPEELSRLSAYVERGGPSGDRARALADVFWALLNSSEFGFNH